MSPHLVAMSPRDEAGWHTGYVRCLQSMQEGQQLGSEYLMVRPSGALVILVPVFVEKPGAAIYLGDMEVVSIPPKRWRFRTPAERDLSVLTWASWDQVEADA